MTCNHCCFFSFFFLSQTMIPFLKGRRISCECHIHTEKYSFTFVVFFWTRHTCLYLRVQKMLRGARGEGNPSAQTRLTPPLMTTASLRKRRRLKNRNNKRRTGGEEKKIQKYSSESCLLAVQDKGGTFLSLTTPRPPGAPFGPDAFANTCV